jgi:ribonuclease HIII
VTQTQVFVLDRAAAGTLEQRLRQELTGEVEWRRVDHARYALKAEGLSVVCYNSGKLVVQGRGADEFRSRFLEGAVPKPLQGQTRAEEALLFEVPTIGSDEAGKGDYFGPLVVASVFAAPEQLDELRAIGVADSKSLSDRRMYAIAEKIESDFACEVRVLMPEDYNARWQAVGNVNHVLADLHADAISALVRANVCEEIVVDRFGDERLVADRLRRILGSLEQRLVQVPRAEAHPVVAAASIVARIRFLEGLAVCEQEGGTDLHKGAGEPVDVAARRAFAIGGTELLQRIAKLHFRNSQKIPGFRP